MKEYPFAVGSNGERGLAEDDEDDEPEDLFAFTSEDLVSEVEDDEAGDLFEFASDDDDVDELDASEEEAIDTKAPWL